MRENPFEDNVVVAEKHDEALKVFRARFTSLLLCFPDPRLLMSDLRTVWPDVSKDTTMITGRLTSFVEMLFERLCKFKISIFTNNKVFTSLRYMPPMGREIFI
jgi:hypothetical protein